MYLFVEAVYTRPSDFEARRRPAIPDDVDFVWPVVIHGTRLCPPRRRRSGADRLPPRTLIPALLAAPPGLDRCSVLPHELRRRLDGEVDRPPHGADAS